MSKGLDELTAPSTDIASEALAFTKSLDLGAEQKLAQVEMDTLSGESKIDSDLEVESTWADPEPEEAGIFAKFPAKLKASKSDTPESPTQTIKFKANGEDIELSLEEAQKRLSLAEGARQALQDRAKLTKEVQNLKKQSEELAKYKDTWEKLEAVKHDRKQLLEMITGESYDDFIQREAQRREVYQNGTEEQRQLLEYSERVQRLERERELETKKREREMQSVEESKFEAEKQRVQTAMEREYYKHQIPEDLEPAAQNKLKTMLWKQSAEDLKQYHAKYGKITNKMVEKAFEDNARVLLGSMQKAVEKEVAKTREVQKQSAKEKAQIASVKGSDDAVVQKLSGMNPNQLFDFFRKGR